jgi:two-component system, cell cycle response regulator
MTADPTVILQTNEVSLFQHIGSPTARRSCLILYSGTETGKRFVLDSQAMTIGRLPNTDIYIDAPSVSRRHAELSMVGDAVMIRDLGSSNGTHVNNQPIEGSVVLRDGDLIRLGKVFLKFYEQESLDALLHDRIYRMATVDVGTDLFNRQYLTDVLKSEIKLARLAMRPLSVIYYDLDHFKSVNDRYGHSTGDLVLKESAGVVKGIVRKADILGRMGGEEFIVVLPGTPLVEAAELAERIRVAVEAHAFTVETDSRGGKHQMVHRQTVSLGVTQLAENMNEVKDLLDAADRLLYRAKETGRNKVYC